MWVVQLSVHKRNKKDIGDLDRDGADQNENLLEADLDANCGDQYVKLVPNVDVIFVLFG